MRIVRAVLVFSVVIACKADADSGAKPPDDAAAEAGTWGLDACLQCAKAKSVCACDTMDCIRCMYVDPLDAPSCSGVPYSARNFICNCLRMQCKDACPPGCR